MTRFERRYEKLAPLPVFIRRLATWLGLALLLIGFSLSVGIVGYHWIAGFDLIDLFLQASMILGGMGPVKEMNNNGAKIFASLYALFSGLVLIGVMGVVLAPIVHRIMHS